MTICLYAWLELAAGSLASRWPLESVPRHLQIRWLHAGTNMYWQNQAFILQQVWAGLHSGLDSKLRKMQICYICKTRKICSSATRNYRIHSFYFLVNLSELKAANNVPSIKPVRGEPSPENKAGKCPQIRIHIKNPRGTKVYTEWVLRPTTHCSSTYCISESSMIYGPSC